MTVAVASCPTPVLQFFNNAGQPNVGGSVLTQVGGVNYVTYQDSAGTIALPNPIPLNSRGEVSNASGASCQLFLVEGVTYEFTLFDANGNQLNQATYVASAATFYNGLTVLAGATVLAGTLSVAGAAALAETLEVAGETTLAGVTATSLATPNWDLETTAGLLQNTGNTQPMFHAHLGNVTINSGSQLIFSTIDSQQGTGYDNATSVFTAPVAGTYLLTCNATILNNSAGILPFLMYFDLSASPFVAGSASISLPAGDGACIGMSCVVKLAAAETVSVLSPQTFASATLTQEGGSTGVAEAGNIFSAVLLF